ncbi:helix-turn-helix transcriptional regulator [Pelagicoccus enzymogenes]|nr:winged helix-turn-helix domain-containing protein [Pelagicoccus enzymogenes]MDQ8199847.1 winged helix-turn-helix domain-containing protein [Pelagicoccus enzymogenes]
MAIQTKKAAAAPAKEQSHWTFFSNHAHVLLCIDMSDDKVLRDVAVEVGITERAVQKIVADLEAAGIITRFKEGRRNRYKINRRVKLRHAIESHRTVGDLLDFVHKD